MILFSLFIEYAINTGETNPMWIKWINVPYQNEWWCEKYKYKWRKNTYIADICNIIFKYGESRRMKIKMANIIWNKLTIVEFIILYKTIN